MAQVERVIAVAVVRKNWGARGGAPIELVYRLDSTAVFLRQSFDEDEDAEAATLLHAEDELQVD